MAVRYFPKIDLSEAYLQIPTDDESSKLLCISTHRGLFKYQRLPFGVKTPPAVFHQIMNTMLAGLDFATAYLDDILVKSNTIEEHTSFLKKIFERIRKYGLKIKENKCDFLLGEIKYLGHEINKDGKKPV